MKKVFYGWWVVLATSLIHLWGAGTFFYCFTAFFNPISNEFGWSYAATSFAASIRSIEGGVLSPVIGLITDKIGSRRLLLFGALLSGIGFFLFSLIHSLAGFYAVFIFLSIAVSLQFPIPGWTAVTNWFARKRGTAIGILSGAIGVGGMLIYLVNWLIATYGWRATLVIIGIGFWLIGIPCAFVVRHSPEPYGLSPDGDRPLESSSSDMKEPDGKANRHLEGLSLSEALRTKTFWMIALMVSISSATVHAVIVHVMPHFISLDLSREKASLVASFLVVVSIIGRFGLGWLGNRIDKRHLMALALFLQGAGLLFLTGATSIWQALLFILSFGPGYGGAITLRLTMLADYFGRRAFGAIQGVILAITVIGSMTSPVLTGMVFDSHGSYRLAWLFLAGLTLAGGPLAFFLRSPREATPSSESPRREGLHPG